MSENNNSQDWLRSGRDNPYAFLGGTPVALAEESTRTTFIRRVYTHMFGAVLAFAALQFVLLNTPAAATLTGFFYGTHYGTFILLGMMIGASWLASYWAHSAISLPVQYAGLGLYVVAQSLVAAPLLYVANHSFPGQHLIESAALITVAVFAGLTAVVWFTKVDLSFMGKILTVVGITAFATIIVGMIFGFTLGIWFTGLMIALACGYIMYDTSMILHHYTEDRYVGAALELFASVIMLFYQILIFLMKLQSRD
ncbi:MAG: Bax inhibitor-1 family protein [Pirellulales bacterium]|nr:Bax inhibitor-1 family protein [Pirellulales bacterium]